MVVACIPALRVTVGHEDCSTDCNTWQQEYPASPGPAMIMKAPTEPPRIKTQYSEACKQKQPKGLPGLSPSAKMAVCSIYGVMVSMVVQPNLYVTPSHLSTAK